MKAFLMYPDRDFDTNQPLPWNKELLIQDLELNTLIGSMSAGDEFLADIAMKTLLTGVNNDIRVVTYRQDILKDSLKNTSIVQEIFRIANEAVEKEKKIYWGIFSKYPIAILDRSIEVLKMFITELEHLRSIADQSSELFSSEGFKVFFQMLKRELSDDYFVTIKDHLQTVKFKYGVLISAELGRANKGTNYVLREPDKNQSNWLARLFNFHKQVSYSYTIDGRDEAGTRALSDLRDKGINGVANALAQSCDHILSFFNMLRTELAFYMGCLNLSSLLTQLGEPSCFPIPLPREERDFSCTEIYDICLAITMKRKLIGNNLSADHKNLVIITGANQGGKSTFLRSVGLTQLMMQSGMFVPAESFRANLCDNLFTHYKREEDTMMSSGKLDEELNRMDQIIDHITPNSLVLLNESFAATNEREGSELARQITLSLIEHNIKVFFVSHLYDFTHSLYEKKPENAIFLRAERQRDGKRTFMLREGEPLQTSYGKDLYYKIRPEKVNQT